MIQPCFNFLNILPVSNNLFPRHHDLIMINNCAQLIMYSSSNWIVILLLSYNKLSAYMIAGGHQAVTMHFLNIR